MTTYQEVQAAHSALVVKTTAVMGAERSAAEAEFAKRLAAASASVTTSRNAMLADAAAALSGNPVAVAKAGMSLAGMAVAQAKANDMAERIQTLREQGEKESLSVIANILDVASAVRTELASGKQTPTRFHELGERWTAISADVKQLSQEMNAGGAADATWQAAFSSGNYRQAAIPQFSALAELSQVTHNNSATAHSVATLQEAIYLAVVNAMKSATTTIGNAGANPVGRASNGQFFGGTITARAVTRQLADWISMGSVIFWRLPSFQIMRDAVLSLGSVETLADGWPARGPAEGQGGEGGDSSVTQVDAREFDLGDVRIRAEGSNLTL